MTPTKQEPAGQIDQRCINTAHTLLRDAVQQANSGHTRTPMALAPVAYCLWQQFLRFDPENPIWRKRDGFVLSVGHGARCGRAGIRPGVGALCGPAGADHRHAHLWGRRHRSRSSSASSASPRTRW